jgi:uncharacterized membrane protein YtjA (UPF0391 family)
MLAMETIKPKILDFITFTLIALVALMFGFGDTGRVAMLIDRAVFYVAAISAAVSLPFKRRER